MTIIDDPEVKAEGAAVFAAYEAALVGNGVATPERLFHGDHRTIRYGEAENLDAMDAIHTFRRARPAQGLADTVITTDARDVAAAMTLTRDGAPGRRSQTWLRPPDGWKAAAAQVSVIGARRRHMIAASTVGQSPAQ